MKNSARTLTALAAALLIPLGAFAADAVTPPAKAPDAKAEVKSEAKPTRKAEIKCEQPVASRIQKGKSDCDKGALGTRTYTREEIESTGQTDTAEALRRLDPRVH